MSIMEIAQLLGNFGEFVGSIAVVVTLFYLAVQVKNGLEATQQNTAAIRSQASMAVNDSLAQLNSSLYADPGMADIWMRGRAALSNLDDSEAVRFRAFMLTRLNLAVYIEDLERQNAADVHIAWIEYLAREINQYPGVKEFVISLRDRWTGSPALYRRLIAEP